MIKTRRQKRRDLFLCQLSETKQRHRLSLKSKYQFQEMANNGALFINRKGRSISTFTVGNDVNFEFEIAIWLRGKWKPLQASSPSTFLGFQDSLGFHGILEGFFRVLRDFLGFSMNLLGFIGIYWDLFIMDLLGFHWDFNVNRCKSDSFGWMDGWIRLNDESNILVVKDRAKRGNYVCVFISLLDQSAQMLHHHPVERKLLILADRVQFRPLFIPHPRWIIRHLQQTKIRDLLQNFFRIFSGFFRIF